MTQILKLPFISFSWDLKFYANIKEAPKVKSQKALKKQAISAPYRTLYFDVELMLNDVINNRRIEKLNSRRLL